MAYFGKVFNFEKEENFEAFVSALVQEEESAKKFQAYKPSQKVEKVGDGYKLSFTTPKETKEISFKSGEAFDETVTSGLVAKNVVTVDGDTFTQVQDFGERGTITTKREFSESQLKVTITTSKWDGVAYRWYTPA